jgi:hypothetical protein
MMCHPFDDQLIAFLKAYAGSQKPGALPGQGQEKIVHVTTLKLYESSFCTGMDCRPGDIARPAATVSGAGVHFNLFFAFSFADAADPNLDKYFDTFNVSTGYIAPEWIVAQCDGAGADPSLHVRGGCVDRSGGEPQPGPSE